MATLTNAEFEWTAFFEKTPDLVCIAGKDGFFRKINPSVSGKLGYSEEELFSRPIASFIHPEDKELTAGKREALLNGIPLINFQNRYLTKKGDIIWLHWTSIYFPDKEVVFALAKDVTERKAMELEVQEKYRKFKSLATHFKNSIEKDRKYFAVELHEELAQLVSVLKMDIDWLSQNIPSLPDSAINRMEHASTVTDLLIRTIRRISFSVSPNMLDDVGLNEALQWLCREFSLLNGITCQFESLVNEEKLPPDIKLDFFRICQHSLSHILSYSEATLAKIRITDEDNQICLQITDNGKGFNLPGDQQESCLNTIKERATSFDGELTVKSTPGQGTTICVSLPLRLKERD